jgi:acyl-CoA synthetase (AMP-forming)/AMP-acid ligase II
MLAKDLIARSARAYPDAVAFVDGERRTTWRELHRRSDRLAAALQGLGVGKGDAVALLAHDRIELMEHWWACLKIGALRTGVNYRYAPREIAHIVRDCDARTIVVQDSLRELLDAELADEGRTLIGLGADHGLALDYEQLIADGGEVVAPALSDDDAAAISYTSGTTGLPKGALFTQRGVREALTWMHVNVGLRHEDVWVNALPCAGAAMIFSAANAANGMTCVMPDGPFRPDRFLELVAEHRVTSAILVPTMLSQLLVELDRGDYDTSSLRLLCYGSMPASPALIRAVQERFGCEVQQWYSATELTAAPAVILRDAAHRHAIAHEPELLTSCGAATPLIDLEVRTAEGDPVPVGEVGEVWVRGDVVFGGYLNRPEETADVLVGEWLRPGDLGRMDERGNLYLVDRKKFMIISGGYNVFPVVVENVLAEHPAVREVAVVGAPHPTWGEAVVAVVSLREGADAAPAELIAFCEGKVGKWEVPKHVEIHDELPKGATAKIQKHEIRSWFRDEPARLPWAADEAVPAAGGA